MDAQVLEFLMGSDCVDSVREVIAFPNAVEARYFNPRYFSFQDSRSAPILLGVAVEKRPQCKAGCNLGVLIELYPNFFASLFTAENMVNLHLNRCNRG